MALDIPRLSYNDIKLKANEFNDIYNSSNEIPVPIELIIESQLDIRINLHPHLGSTLENESFITKDFKEIWINENLPKYYLSRYRFSLAHEIGHFRLHQFVYDQIPDYKTSEEFKQIYLDISPNNFAAALLVPDFALEDQFSASLKRIMPQIVQAKDKGFAKAEYIGWVAEEIASELAEMFEVSLDTVKYRILNDTIYNSLIP